MSSYRAFLFESYRFEFESGTLRLRYAFEGGPSFEEEVVFPLPLQVLSAQKQEALDRVFRLVFLLAGVSYYKAYAPEFLSCPAFPLDARTASFVEETYLRGLGEFAFRNQLDLRGKIVFDAKNGNLPPAETLGLSDAILVPVGGGKDSIVTLETLKRAGKKIVLFAVASQGGVAEPILETIKVSGLPSLIVTRTLSPNLGALKDALNGHIPITAIVSALALAAAILHDCGSVALSCERSANAPNLRQDGFEVNHQYSKSFAFESRLAAYVREVIASDLLYFSFLRPLSEAAIAKRFAALEAYHPVFRSCNAAFRQDKNARAAAWCCACPKCRFVFLALAPFMEKEKLAAFFGANLLDDSTQMEGFRELCGLSSHKPFECVGEIEESAMLLRKLARKEEWKNDKVVKALALALPQDEAPPDALFALSEEHGIPPDLRRLLDAS